MPPRACPLEPHPTAVQRLERARDGGDLTLHVTPEAVILNHGEPLQDVDQPPPSAVRPNVNPHSPVRHLGQEHLTVARKHGHARSSRPGSRRPQ